LSLDHRPKSGRNGGDAKLGAFRVECSAESLKVSAEQHDVTPQVLIKEGRVCRCQRCDSRALRIDLSKARHAVILPLKESSRRHDLASAPVFLDTG
jgi:hypothetical protein